MKFWKVFMLVGLMLGALLLMAEPQIRYRVQPDKCIGCQICARKCPTQAISMVQGKAVINPEKCIQCGLCARACPVQAIVTDTLTVTVTNVDADDETADTLETVLKPVPEPERKPEPKPEPEIIESVPRQQGQQAAQTNTLSTYAMQATHCVGCEVCTHQCPVQAISMQAGKAVIDQQKCISCGLCEQACPFAAVSHTP